MQPAIYLSLSRNGIFYFRLPIPGVLHPLGRRTDVKVSLLIRSPAEARQLSRLLVTAGQSRTAYASRGGMRYDEIRKHVQTHYRVLLKAFKSRIAESGPISDSTQYAMQVSKGWAKDDLEGFLAIGYPDGTDGLLTHFCELEGIKEKLNEADKQLLLREISLAFRTFADAALAHTEVPLVS